MSTPTDPLARVAELPGVADAVTAAREGVDALLGHRVMRRRRPEVTAEAALHGARASAALEGVDVPLETLRSGAGLEDPVVRAAVRVSTEVGQLRTVWEKTPLQALARLHMVAGADVVTDRDALGRPRTAEAAVRIERLSDLLLAPSTAPAVVVAAIVHGELLAIAPFGWGNGLVARAASRLTLVSRGLDPTSVSAPEVGHMELGVGAYAAALESYRSGTADGVAAWVRHCAEAISLGAREGLAVCAALERG